jgi:dephospho-CoA kinase
MPAIGITGGIATGKTSFLKCLRELLAEDTPQGGSPATARFFDADVAARELVNHDPEVRGLIEAEFGKELFERGRDLNRERLRSIVFADVEKKRALEQILHPRIRRQWSLEAEGHRNSTKLFFADIPLLYETGSETVCDQVVVVACSPGVQLERLLARRGYVERRAGARSGGLERGASRELRPPLDEMTAQRMIDAQMPLTEKVSRANHVVWNNAGRDGLKEQARLLLGLWKDRRGAVPMD